jgi:hypothetical protein
MTHTWIIQESTPRWAAALRMALARQTSLSPAIRIRELRSLPELVHQLALAPHGLVLTEVTRRNLEATLSWLTHHSQETSPAPVVALLDLQKTGDAAGLPMGHHTTNRRNTDDDIVASALREAGAVDVLNSPRQVPTMFTFAERLLTSRTDSTSTAPPADQPFADWAWSLLPWQDAQRPLG